MTKQQLAAAAFRAIADIIEQAPLESGPALPYSADDILESFCLFDSPFHDLIRDPTAQEDGLLNGCTICATEAHDADCPVGALDALCVAGIDTDRPFPDNLSVKGVRVEYGPCKIDQDGCCVTCGLKLSKPRWCQGRKGVR